MARQKNVQATLNLKVPVLFEKDEEYGGYVVSSPDFDVFSQGDTIKQAEARIKDAIGLFLVTCFEEGTLNQVMKDCGFKESKPKKLSKTSPKNLREINLQVPLSAVA